MEFMEERREFLEDVNLEGVNLATYSLSRREREGDGGTEVEDEGVGGGEVWLVKRRGGGEGRLDISRN